MLRFVHISVDTTQGEVTVFTNFQGTLNTCRKACIIGELRGFTEWKTRTSKTFKSSQILVFEGSHVPKTAEENTEGKQENKRRNEKSRSTVARMGSP